MPKFFPYTLHGDAFFDSIDGWIDELSLGAKPVRSEKAIKESMWRGVIENPVFNVLSNEFEFNRLIEKIKNIKEA